MIAKLLDWPPVWLVGFLALGYGLAQQTDAQALDGPAARWLPMLALGLIGAGLALMFVAAAQFAARKTTVIPHRQPSALVTEGVYRFSRNPIYLADVAILVGALLWWQAYAALISVPVFMAVIEWRFIRPEEKRLQAHFGAEYDRWAASVRRWL